MIKQQVLTENYGLFNGDCMEVLPTLPTNSVDLSCYSPPFLSLFVYSSHDSDFSNCENREQALQQYEFLVMELARVTKPGRICAVHCTDLMNKDSSQFDYPHEITKIHQRHGFKRMNKITIWKEPLKVRMRTMVKSLMHKLIVEDSTECYTAMPDYLLIFKRDGKNEVPVTHPTGLSQYFGATPFLPDHLSKYGLPSEYFTLNGSFADSYEAYMWDSFRALQKKYAGHKDPKTNKLSHIIWQRYASSVWDDIRIDNVLPFRDGRDEDDEKHVHPLQLDVIDRVVELYSNKGELVLTPFMGVGSEVYSPVSLGRKAIGVELKESYFKQAILNLEACEQRFSEAKQLSLI